MDRNNWKGVDTDLLKRHLSPPRVEEETCSRDRLNPMRCWGWAATWAQLDWALTAAKVSDWIWVPTAVMCRHQEDSLWWGRSVRLTCSEAFLGNRPVLFHLRRVSSCSGTVQTSPGAWSSGNLLTRSDHLITHICFWSHVSLCHIQTRRCWLIVQQLKQTFFLSERCVWSWTGISGVAAPHTPPAGFIITAVPHSSAERADVPCAETLSWLKLFVFSRNISLMTWKWSFLKEGEKRRWESEYQREVIYLTAIKYLVIKHSSVLRYVLLSIIR